MKDAKPRRLVAYDLETTNIAAGTPRPLYVTMFGADEELARRLGDMPTLTKVLLDHFLTEDMRGASFVAWNGNRFDAVLIAAALLTVPGLVLRPYVTRTKALRGLKVLRAEDDGKRTAKGWEFLDGIAMTGLTGVKLSTFVARFAPEYPKLIDIIDFEAGETFDADNPEHRRYAMRDSEGLWHAITRAQSIMVDTFGEPLAVTMGGACIRVFAAHIPRDVEIEALHFDLTQIVQTYVTRGGFCFCVRRYQGPVWKYDLNQAYAAAMREAKLPAGAAVDGWGEPPRGRAYIVRLTATNPHNTVPFYVRSFDGVRARSDFATIEIGETWITSIEHAQLMREGWTIRCKQWWAWPETFDMSEYVGKLETLRMSCDGGPSGAIGTMVKATGNHSFGKTLETVEPVEYVLAAECPDDCLPYYDDESGTPHAHVFYRVDDSRRAKAHHQPHIGSFITAYVRMVLRRAVLHAPDAWLYADTDCVIFSRDMRAHLDIDPKRYGAWKIEEEGARYALLAKKVYTELPDPGATHRPKKSAKGLHVDKVSPADFQEWFDGRPPEQTQTQLQNFFAVVSGGEMFAKRTRKGTAIHVTR